MKTLTFSHNWNHKLFQNCFTTFRIHNSGKFIPGDIVEFQLNFETNMPKKFQAEFLSGCVTTLYEVPEILCYLDTGYCKKDFIAMVKKMYLKYSLNFDTQLFSFYLFKRLNPLKINLLQASF